MMLAVAAFIIRPTFPPWTHGWVLLGVSAWPRWGIGLLAIELKLKP